MALRTIVIAVIMAGAACGPPPTPCSTCPDVKGKYTGRLGALLVSKDCTAEGESAGFAFEVQQDQSDITVTAAGGWLTLKVTQGNSTIQITLYATAFKGTLYAGSPAVGGGEENGFYAASPPPDVPATPLTIGDWQYDLRGTLTGSFKGATLSTGRYLGRLTRVGTATPACTVDGQLTGAKNPNP